MESRPVGRIDYLGSNGAVRESIEYTSEYQFVKDIKDENFYGVPMVVVLYRDKDGKTISQDFVAELDPPVQGLKIETFAVMQETLLNKAKELINAFCEQEYGEPADFSDLTKIGIAYTETPDYEVPVQVNVNLEEYEVNVYLGGKLLESRFYGSLTELIENELNNLEFSELTYISDDDLNKYLAENGIEAEQEEAVSEPVKPAWEQKRTRVQTFDLHPDIPMSERHTFDLASHEVEEVGKKERFRRNLMAIQLLKKCQSENRFATPEEQEILSKYVGWGGIPEAFDENNPSWGTEYLELSTVLTPEEYESAKDSVLTAFYTPPVVIQGIYKAMEQMGFRDGNILEPACGIGNFIGITRMEVNKMPRTSMSVREMGQSLGIKKVESYWLVKKNLFEVRVVAGKMRVMIASFDEWYASQFHYKKVNGEPPGSKWTASTLSVSEVAAVLGIAEATVYDVFKKGYFQTLKIDNRTRVDRASFDEWFSSQTRYPLQRNQPNILYNNDAKEDTLWHQS